MVIWLIMSGEPLEQFGERPHRVGILSKMLVAQKHKVTWWTTAYDHQHKKYLYKKDVKLTNSFGVDMYFLHPKTAYTKNISINRIINHNQVAEKFKILSVKNQTPDIIFCAFPTIDLAYQAVQYGLNNNVPVVLDVRDLWPDIFKNAVPSILKPFMSLLLVKMYKKTKYAFKNAYAISGITDDFVNYGIKHGGREKKSIDMSFPFGYPTPNLTENIKQEAYKKLEKSIDFKKFIICYFGTIGSQFDFNPVIKAAKKLENEDIQFVVCGKGSSLEDLKNKTKDLSNFILPGWLNKNEILTLMENSKAGLSPYINSRDFLTSLSNKTIEYLAGALPVLSSINGVSGKLFQKHNCGIVYGKNETKLVESILLLKNDLDLQKKMSLNAKSLFESQFSAELVYSNMISYFKDVISKYNR